MTVHSGEAIQIMVAMVPHQDITSIYLIIDKLTVNVGGLLMIMSHSINLYD